jgi:hypothetical protein
MEPKKIWTAAQLDEMTPGERQKIFDESIVQDLDQVPADFLDRIRAKVLAREASQDAAELRE